MPKSNDLIYETKHFTVQRHPQPFVSRTDGGHIRIFPKDKHRVTDRTQLHTQEAIEYIRLSMLVGEALQSAMNKLGIPVVKINYQEMGNWAFKRNERPVMHLHIFGRSKDAKYQIFPEALHLPDRSTGFYDHFVPLTDSDMKLVKKHIEKLSNSPKYSQPSWKPAHTLDPHNSNELD